MLIVFVCNVDCVFNRWHVQCKWLVKRAAAKYVKLLIANAQMLPRAFVYACCARGYPPVLLICFESAGGMYGLFCGLMLRRRLMAVCHVRAVRLAGRVGVFQGCKHYAASV